MADKIVVQYDLQMQQAEAELKGFEKELRKTEVSGKKSMGSISSESKKAGNEIGKTSTSVNTLSSSLSNLANNLPFAGQIKQVTELGSAVSGLGGAAQKSSAGFQILKTAIIGTGIGALVIGLIALITYFKRTDEGAAKLSGIMSGLGAAADVVTGFIVGLGEGVFNALTSVEGFKQGLMDLGNFIVGQLLNRLNAPLVFLDAMIIAFKEFKENGVDGDFAPALKKASDGLIQLSTGIEDGTDKIAAFTEKAAAAAAAAYAWEIRMDELEDKIRKDSTAIAENDRAITKLIIASKNKNIEDEKSLAFLDQATKLEKQNLAITLQNERAKLALIQERNAQTRDSINQDRKALTDELKAENTSAARKKAILKELRSIGDDDAQKEVDQINKIIQIQQASDNLLEKVQNRRDAKEEEIFQNQIKRIAQTEILAENAAKEEFLIGTKSAQQLEDAIYQIKLDGLIAQKELLLTESRDIIDVDKAILDLQLANLDKHNKEKSALEKQAREDKAKADKKANDDFLAGVEARLKEEDEKVAAHEAAMKAIKQQGFAITEELAKGFADISAQKRQQELDAELEKYQTEIDTKMELNQKQLDEGIISQEQFDARKAALDQKAAAKTAEVKKKQYQADKKAALIQVAIDTALAIAKSFAQLGPVGGLLGAALVAAQGLAQAALISSQPTPKFKDGVVDLKGKGTGTSDSIPAMLSRGESVMTAKATRENYGLLKAIHEGSKDDYIERAYISPAMRKMEVENIRAAKERRDKKESRYLSLMGNGTDMSTTNKLLKKNGNVNLNNIDELAKALSRESGYNNPLFK